MRNVRTASVCIVAAVSLGSGVLAAEPPRLAAVQIEAPVLPAVPKEPSKPVAYVVATPALEPPPTAIANAGFATKSPFTASLVPSPDTSLSPPVTITYSGSSPTLQINDSGTNKGVQSVITNASNQSSALYGSTNGSGAGLTGYNSGTVGPGGKFVITNANSAQPGAFATTNGTGPALLGTITTANSQEAAIVGQNILHSGYGVGVQGQGNQYGVVGTNTTAGVGVYGSTSSGDGVWGFSPSGIGTYGQSSSGYALYGASESGPGLFASSQSNYGVLAVSESGTALSAKANGSGYGITVSSESGVGISSVSGSSYAILAQSQGSIGVFGEDLGAGSGVYGGSATGTGVYGYSGSSWAGYFDGPVYATSYSSGSDRNSKTNIQAIDGKAILDKVSKLPVSSWVFKSDPEKRHLGPMAQDFHAVFGLDGNDDTHINMTDIVGVSMAAIQELSNEVKQKDADIAAQLAGKDAEIAALKDQLKSMGNEFSARVTALERQQRSGVATQTVSLKKASAVQGE